MFEIALVANGQELNSVPGYRRQPAPITAISGGVVIFPKLGVSGKYQRVDQVVVIYPAGHAPHLRIYNIRTGPYNHLGDKDLRIIFASKTTVSATSRTAEDMADFRKLRELLDDLSEPEAESEEP